MSVYLIVQINIKHQELYNQLIDQAIPIFSACNARMLAASNTTTVLEMGGVHQFEQTLIIEFESEDDLKNWYETIKQVGFLKQWRSASESYLVSYVDGVEPL